MTWSIPAHLDKNVTASRPPNLKVQSLPVPGTKRPGQTAHYRNEQFGLLDRDSPNFLKTLPAIFENGFALARDEPFLGHRPVVSQNPLKFADHYVWETYAQVDVKRRAVGSALHAWFKDGTLGGGEYETVGIWSANTPQWQIVDTALHAYAKVGVSLYDTLGKDSVEFILNHSHLTVVFATTAHIASLLKLAPQVSHLKMIVSMDPLNAEMKHVLSSWASNHGIAVKEMSEVIEYGVAHPLPPIPATPETLANICYTSGTTGNPKGALLTHRALSAAVQGQLCGFTLNEFGRPSIISYLPLAHIFERMNELAIMAIGGSIGYFTGDPLRLMEDAQILKPMYFPSVPRVLNRVYQAAMVAGNAPGLRGAIFRRAVATKVARVRADGVCTHPVWDRIVFRKVQAALGGNVKLISTGSAPIAAEVLDFMRVAFACDVWEGYGLTETSALATKVMRHDPTSSGCIGIPIPVTEMKLVDVPTMNYTADDRPNPRGEICVRGPQNFIGYYKNEKATRETIDEEGWVHTGDVGEIDRHGRFRIVDRVKNIMKLAQGEYVALEKIENLYMTCPLVAQLFVHGDSMQAFLVAVVVPDPVQFAALCSRATGGPVRAEELEKMETLGKDPRVVGAVLKELDEVGKRNLKGFEMIKRVHLTLAPFTVENGTLTPTLKIKRKDAYEMHKRALDALYAGDGAAVAKL